MRLNFLPFGYGFKIMSPRPKILSSFELFCFQRNIYDLWCCSSNNIQPKSYYIFRGKWIEINLSARYGPPTNQSINVPLHRYWDWPRINILNRRRIWIESHTKISILRKNVSMLRKKFSVLIQGVRRRGRHFLRNTDN